MDFIIQEDISGRWTTHYLNCLACENIIIELGLNQEGMGLGTEPLGERSENKKERRFLAYPKGVARTPLSPLVPEEYAEDYKEACLVLNDSPKASAALSRRCLQSLIHNKAGIEKANLYQEIEALLAGSTLPPYIAGAIDAIRNIGNFAAHALRTHAGEIVDVEPEEAEWALDILESLFDFYFVQPAQLKEKQEKMNEKLTKAGKKPMIQPEPQL